jgi:hypothetical protein
MRKPGRKSDLVQVVAMSKQFRADYGMFFGLILTLRAMEVAARVPTFLKAGWLVAIVSIAVNVWLRLNS